MGFALVHVTSDLLYTVLYSLLFMKILYVLTEFALLKYRWTADGLGPRRRAEARKRRRAEAKRGDDRPREKEREKPSEKGEPRAHWGARTRERERERAGLRGSRERLPRRLEREMAQERARRIRVRRGRVCLLYRGTQWVKERVKERWVSERAEWQVVTRHYRLHSITLCSANIQSSVYWFDGMR